MANGYCKSTKLSVIPAEVSNVEEAMKGNTVNNPVTLLASGGCTADLVTTALMSLLRHKPPDMNGTQLVMVDYPTI